MPLVWIILFSILGSVGAIMIASVFLLPNKKIHDALIPYLIAYATGTLLASAFLGLIPHALEHADASPILSTVLIGIVLFFILEKLMIWRHCHKAECKVHRSTASMILVGDAIHNMVDGVVIAASFLASIPVGFVAGLSVIAHEIPQEVGDFGILLHQGYPKKKALFLNLLSGMTTLPAAVISYYTLESIQSIVPYIMAISAASFLYISLSDLLPGMHGSIGLKQSIRQLILVLAGIATIAFVLQFHP